jgi:hypothetical protein
VKKWLNILSSQPGQVQNNRFIPFFFFAFFAFAVKILQIPVFPRNLKVNAGALAITFYTSHEATFKIPYRTITHCITNKDLRQLDIAYDWRNILSIREL